jgi:hypothetical protein
MQVEIGRKTWLVNGLIVGVLRRQPGVNSIMKSTRERMQVAWCMRYPEYKERKQERRRAEVKQPVEDSVLHDKPSSRVVELAKIVKAIVKSGEGLIIVSDRMFLLRLAVKV